MNVSDHSALRLLKAFARLEFALKQFPQFTKGDPAGGAETQWTAYYPTARRLLEAHVTPEALAVLLGTGVNAPPPKKMMLNAQRSVEFVDQPLEGPLGDRLLDASRRVRNNLVHGGKEHRLQQRYDGHDQRLVDAATEVIYLAATADPEVERLVFAP